MIMFMKKSLFFIFLLLFPITLSADIIVNKIKYNRSDENRTAEVNCSHKNESERKESELYGRKNDILCTGQRKYEP